MGNLIAKQYIVTFSGDATFKADARKASSSYYSLKGVKTVSAGPYTRVVVFTAAGTQMRELVNSSKSDTMKLTVLPSFDHAVIHPYGPGTVSAPPQPQKPVSTVAPTVVEGFDGQMADGVDDGWHWHLLIIGFFLMIALKLYTERQ